MDNKMVNLEIDKDLIKDVMARQIQSAIISNIGDPGEIIAQAVKVALDQKVDANGNVSNYNSDNRYDFLEQLTRKKIQVVADEVIKEWVQKYADQIKKQIKVYLEKPAATKKIVKSVVDACTDNISSWYFKANIDFRQRED